MRRLENSRPLAGALLVALCLAVTPGSSPAQLELQATTWDEWIQFSVDDGTTDVVGSDPSSPEPLSREFLGAGYTCRASIAFAQGPPNATAYVDLDISTPAINPNVVARCDITYAFRVRQVGTPPTPVTWAPLTILRSGSVAILSGTAVNAAVASEFHANSDGGSVNLHDEISANNFAGPTTDSFNSSDTVTFLLAETGSVTMWTSVDLGAASAGGRVRAEGMVDPIIEVADQLIPGTSSNFREFFEVELGDGYWALPSSITSWGSLKGRFTP